MFKRAIPIIIIVTMACFSAFDMAAAQESQVIHFQGLLTGPDGGPLRTDIYDINFSIWDHPTDGIEAIWSETQIVEVTEGLFDVFLGSVNPLSADVFTPFNGEDIGLRYLEIEVVGDDPMTPRTQIAKTPNSFVSSRVLGDVVTGPGSLKLMDPSYPEIAGIDMRVDTTEHNLIFWTPQFPWIPAMEMTANAGATSFKMIDPGDEIVGFDVFVGGEGNSIKLIDPTDEVPVAEISSDGFAASMKLIDPGDEIVGFDVFIGGEGNSIKMMEPHDEKSLIEMNGGIGGEASFYMFNPQPEPPAMVMDISSTPFSNASFKMFNTESDAFPAVEMTVDQIANKRLFRMGMPPDDQMPAMEMATGIDENSFKIASPVLGGLRNEITDPKFEVVVDSDGGRLDIHDEIGQYMGLEPMPFVSGGGFYMVDPSTEQTNVWIDSNGRLSVRKGIFGQNITSDGNYNLAVGDENIISGDNSFAGGQLAQANHDNCFVWSDYPLGPSVQPTQTLADNQFLVRATGGVAFYSNANFTSGVALGPGASSWSAIVPPGPDLNMRDVDGEEILTRIGQLPIKYYSHKDEQDDAEHIGPLPGDFNSLFTTGQDDKHISLQDEAGVALAGVKELAKENRELKDIISRMEQRIAELEAIVR